MSNHTCPGLGVCIHHPRWSVIRFSRDKWVAYLPYAFSSPYAFPTHAAAITFAQKEATK